MHCYTVQGKSFIVVLNVQPRFIYFFSFSKDYFFLLYNLNKAK